MKSAHKALPKSFLGLPDAQLRLFLRCAFEAEGHAGANNIEFPTASPTFATQIEYMLLRLGVRCARHVAYKAATNGTGIKRPYVRLTISGEDASAFADKIGFLSHKKQSAARRYGVRGTNPNFGIPVQWVLTRLAPIGLTAKVLGFNNRGDSPTAARVSAEKVCERLLWLASDQAVAHYRKQVRTLGGTAKRFATRTLEAIEGGRAAITQAAVDLQHLLALPLRYEPVVEVAPGASGGYVYDVSVATNCYDHQNYVAGPGGLILHNTLTSIAAGDALDEPIEAIVPAPLVPNYQKEMIKHTGGIPDGARVRSYERTLKERDVRKDGLAVMDEAHKARNAGTGIAKHIAQEVAQAKYRMLLTGTPVYNQAHDLAILLNTAAGRKVLPDDPKLFGQTFVGTKTIQAPLWDRLKGQILGHPVDNVTVPALVNRQRLVDAATGYVDVHQGGGEGFPRRIDELHEIPLGAKQNEYYKFHEGSMPWYLRAKIRAGLPLDKSESKDLNAFQGALRQVSNTARAYDPSMTDEQELKDSRKLNLILQHLNEMRAKNPNHRGVVYSNYLDSGILPLSRALTQQGVAHNVFTGSVSPTQRRTMIEDYNSGKTPLLLLSGAGSEGLDLKGTRSIQLMEPHWNPSRIEQVIGRGLRRVGYDTERVVGADGVERELFRAEYVNVFGVPLSIFQDVGDGGEAPPPPKPSTQIESLVTRNHLEVRWPNVVRIETVVRPTLVVDWAKVETLELDPAQIPIAAELAPALGGAADLSKVEKIDLERIPESFRLQRLTFLAARKAFENLGERFTGRKELLVFQLIRLVEEFFASPCLSIPSLFHQDPLRKRILVSLSIDRVVQHLLRFVTEQNLERVEPVFDEELPIGSTRYMRTWYTTKVCHPTLRSQISHMVADSAWEQHAANLLETSPFVDAYAKNEHLGFQVYYMWNGAKRRYIPDFLIRLANGKTLVLEIKGQDSEQNRAKIAAMRLWVEGVNTKGGFGLWCCDVAYEMAKLQDILQLHGGEARASWEAALSSYSTTGSRGSHVTG
jgi:hypothetical protein